jgi:HK97 family phage prohead protease
MTNETKGFAVDVKVGVGDLGPNEFLSVMSAPTLDRDGEIVDALAFAPLTDKITVDIDHAMSVEKTVGSGGPFYDGDLLKIRGKFASTALAQDVRTLVKEGHVRTMSVTFRNAQRVTGEDGVTHITSAELLNVAFVVIPSNREAVVIGAKDGLAADLDAAETVELEGVDALRARVDALQAEVDELKAVTASLKSPTSEAPEAAPDENAAPVAAAREAAARQRSAVASTARAYLARASAPR